MDGDPRQDALNEIVAALAGAVGIVFALFTWLVFGLHAF